MNTKVKEAMENSKNVTKCITKLVDGHKTERKWSAIWWLTNDSNTKGKMQAVQAIKHA